MTEPRKLEPRKVVMMQDSIPAYVGMTAERMLAGIEFDHGEYSPFGGVVVVGCYEYLKHGRVTPVGVRACCIQDEISESDKMKIRAVLIDQLEEALAFLRQEQPEETPEMTSPGGDA